MLWIERQLIYKKEHRLGNALNSDFQSLMYLVTNSND